MKDRFTHFSIRFLAVLLCGMLLLLLRAVAHDPVSAVFTPRFASPWELSKLVYWPLLITTLLSSRLGGGKGNSRPWLAATPLAAVLAFWALSALQCPPGAYLVAMVILLAAALALVQLDVIPAGKGYVWLVLIVALGVAYVVLTFLPPMAGPFLNPSDVAAMATIPC